MTNNNSMSIIAICQEDKNYMPSAIQNQPKATFYNRI